MIPNDVEINRQIKVVIVLILLFEEILLNLFNKSCMQEMHDVSAADLVYQTQVLISRLKVLNSVLTECMNDRRLSMI